MSINSDDDESSFDLGGGVDLFIQDTQENMTSCGGAVQSEDDGGKAPSPHYPTYECTQVDNGEYSDEDDSVGGGDMYGATQVDDDYLRRMAESAELLDDVGDGNVSVQQDGGSQADDIAESRPSMGTVDININEANVAERVSTEAPAAEACSTIITGASDAEHGDSDEEEDSDGNFVDFCIADTQQPPSRHSSVRNKQTYSNETNEVTMTNMMSLGVPAVELVITANPDAAEDTSLSVYDYLSAPLSNNDGKPEVNVFSALDAIPPPQYSTLYTAKTSNTVGSAAFATAQTGSIYVTHPVGKAAPHIVNPGGVEEEPTQLDGSSVRLSGDSHSLGDHSGNRLSGSHSHGLSSHDTSERSAQSVLLSPELLLEPAVAVAAEANGTVAASVLPVPVLLGATVTRAETEGEWLSVKNIKSHILPSMPPALIRQSPQKATATAPNATTVSNANNVPNQTHAGESETQLSGPGFAENDSQALADALEEKSLEELVRMQEKLSRMINSKIQKTASPVAPAVPSTAATAAASAVLENEAAHVTPSVAASAATVAIAVPLERQQTSYGLSQPSNLAVSSLMLLKSTPGPVTIGSSSSDSGSVNVNANESLTHRDFLSANGASPAGQRKFTTFSAGTAGLAAVTPAGSNVSSSHGGASGLSTGSTTATRSPSPTGTDSSSKRFLKRKFGRPQVHMQALSAVAEDANLQFDMSEGSDSDVASPHSSDDERGRKKAEKGSPSKHMSKKHAGAAVKAVEKTNASPSAVVVSKSKVRRIVIEDTQDDHHDEQNNNDNDNDEDAEFTADYFVSSPQPVRSGGAVTTSNNTNVNNSNNSNSEAKKAREALIAKALPADLPKSLLQNIPEKFVDLWHSLTDLGWFWKRGGGIVSYYYVRPNCLVKKGFLMGRDYFGDEQEVLKFVSKTVKEAKAALLKQGIDMNPPPPPPPPHKVKPVVASASGVTTGNTATSTNTINNASASNNTQTADQQKVPTSRQLVPQFSTVSVTSGQLPPDDPIMSDIHRIPWKWLWKILRARDWSWDFGPGHSNFYFPPGYNIRSKNAVLGEHKFNSEEGVRRYVRKQNWPQFSKGNEKQSQSGAESQLPDAYLHDPNWGLASHRRKRDVRESRFGGDHSSTSDNESHDEGTHGQGQGQKGTSSRKKANKGNGASSKSGSALPSKAQKHAFTPEMEETEQATQAQRMTQISPIKSNKMANQSRAPLIASSATTSGQIFAENRFVVSGIPEKLKTQLIKDIVKLGGKILSSVPVDGDESRDTVVTDEKTGRAVRNGPVFVVSHPREFRKPNYLMALATGVTLVHFQWIVDCKDSSKRLPVEQYLLPSGCCALHAYNIFPTPRTPVVAVGKGSAGLGLGPALEPEGLMDGVKVLNLAGGSWDNLLLTVGAITVENEAPLLQTLQNLRTGSQAGGSASKSGRASRLPVDVILVDPYEYALCASANASASNKTKFSSSGSGIGGRYNTPHSLLAVGSAAKSKTAATSSTPKSPAAKLGEVELQVIQHCAALSSLETASVSNLSARTPQRQAPIVVTTDWLVHCIALDELLDHTLIDLFTLPPEPETRPFTYKADAVTSTGERYSKYDIVYYRSKVAPSAAQSVRNSPIKAPKASEVLLLGKIVGFVRRDEKSQLFARIRPLVSTSGAEAVSVRPDIVVPRGPATEKDLHAVRHKEVQGDPHNALCMIEVERLCGKAILLQKEDFLRVSKYSFSDESVYYVSKAWKEENPCVLDSGDGSESQESEDQDVFQMRIQRSQDY